MDSDKHIGIRLCRHRDKQTPGRRMEQSGETIKIKGRRGQKLCVFKAKV